VLAPRQQNKSEDDECDDAENDRGRRSQEGDLERHGYERSRRLWGNLPVCKGAAAWLSEREGSVGGGGRKPVYEGAAGDSPRTGRGLSCWKEEYEAAVGRVGGNWDWDGMRAGLDVGCVPSAPRETTALIRMGPALREGRMPRYIGPGKSCALVPQARKL
jgi:hypothetical protein